MSRIGSYEVVQQIGEGGFGRTYEARHIHNPEIKACLKQNLNLTEDDTALLKKEAALMAKIHHHSLPTFRDLIKAEDGSYVLAMSFIEGKTLDAIIEKHTALHPEEIAWIGQRLLNALHYLHAEGIVHGDIKPSNVIVQPKKHNAVLIDYGLSSFRPTAKTTAEGYTEVFVAPEVLKMKPPVPQSDLYSLALTLLYGMGGDPLTHSFPDYVPKPFQHYLKRFLQYDTMKRPSWEKDDLVKRLSDVRYKSFGRRHSA